MKNNRAWLDCDCDRGGDGPTLVEDTNGKQIDHERFHIDAPDTDPQPSPAGRKTAWERMGDL